jgi:hypothetical protein
MGKIPEGIRLPLTRLADGVQSTVRQAMLQAGVL